jgi:hypothetical protein
MSLRRAALTSPPPRFESNVTDYRFFNGDLLLQVSPSKISEAGVLWGELRNTPNEGGAVVGKPLQADLATLVWDRRELCWYAQDGGDAFEALLAGIIRVLKLSDSSPA